VQHPGPWRIVVVGGGHAGCEAALACARLGVPTLLLTQNVDRIGWMSCNPAIGGVGKSHLVAEIDALGGEMARATDRAGVHYKWLNASKGAAVRALRVQCDKLAYATAMRRILEQTPGLAIKQADVRSLWLEQGVLRGVETHQGLRFAAEAVVLTAGTFLEAVLHTGLSRSQGGRAGDAPSRGLGDQLRSLGVRTQRHKTGTCPRVDGRTVDWAQLPLDPGLVPPPRMARHGSPVQLPQMPCWVSWTNGRTHELIRGGLDRSPMYTGVIEGTGPRYCPSVEDKVVRFADHDRHQLFLEREGWQTDEVYLNGLSTSLPADVQLAVVRSIDGLAQAEIVRFGYAVEYDAIDARELDTRLQLRALPGLFLAGQVNGTSGYEEAAAQGLLAGLNAVQQVRGQPPVVFTRRESYLGVIVDDLVTLGAAEPYRMFTARAEHRLVLRASNADLRLTERGRHLGLVADEQWQAFEARRERLARAHGTLAHTVRVGEESLPLRQWLARPEVAPDAAAAFLPELDPDDLHELATEVRYAGYVAREQKRQARAERHEHLPIPPELDFAALGNLSREAVQALERVRPETLGQAARIPGVTAAAVQALAFHLLRRVRRAPVVVD
jgi:tRNA uridine 5-carboxymethylaminomethyl modification enzyme